MPSLIILFMVVTVFIFVFLIRYSLLSRLGDMESVIEGLKGADKDIKRRNRDIESEIAALNFDLSKTVNVYETARDICTSLLDEDSFFNKFRENLKNIISCSECLLLDPGKEFKGDISDGETAVFPLSVKDSHLGSLVIKGAAEIDKPYLGILAGQFALGLQRTRLYKIIQDLAITDSLTGLFTRRYATERLREEFSRSQAHKMNLTVLMMDTDNFKKCNDKFGHLVGDIVLTEIGNRIKNSIREVDMLSRFGGEEFMLFAPNTSKDMAFLIAQRILKSVRGSAIRAYDEKVEMTLSIGIASYPADAKSPEDLIGKADWALYQAKRLGKDRACVFGAYYD